MVSTMLPLVAFLTLASPQPSRAEQSAAILANCDCSSRVDAGSQGPDRYWYGYWPVVYFDRLTGGYGRVYGGYRGTQGRANTVRRGRGRR